MKPEMRKMTTNLMLPSSVDNTIPLRKLSGHKKEFWVESPESLLLG
jgi:hypothetical protein